jgi:hypothetical protein
MTGRMTDANCWRARASTVCQREGGSRSLFNDDRTGPFPVAAFNVDMLIAMPGQQYSGRAISKFLKDAGFERIHVMPTFGYWSIVTGVKA